MSQDRERDSQGDLTARSEQIQLNPRTAEPEQTEEQKLVDAFARLLFGDKYN